MGVIMIIASVVVLVVLIITSSTWAEIAVLLLTFFAAALIHQGTNFLLGTISFMSNSVTLILQLALSLDYAIIFCNRYKEEHETYDIRESVERALAKAVPEVFSSSLTTIAGLLAMTFMKFRLGADLGFVLIKAIACSLLSVFLVMPGFSCSSASSWTRRATAALCRRSPSSAVSPGRRARSSRSCSCSCSSARFISISR